jgi:hypothetical protein
MPMNREDTNREALRLAIDRMGDLVDAMHREADAIEQAEGALSPDRLAEHVRAHRLAADYVSDQRKDLQRLKRKFGLRR